MLSGVGSRVITELQAIIKEKRGEEENKMQRTPLQYITREEERRGRGEDSR